MAGGEGEEVLSGKLEDVLWFPQQQKLQKVRHEYTDLWMLPQVRGMVRLQLLLPQRHTHTHTHTHTHSKMTIRCILDEEGTL